MAKTLRLRVLTPEKIVFDGDVDAITAMGEEGDFGVLAGHQPLISKLGLGVLHCKRQGANKDVAVMGGVLTTDGETITVLSPAAELGDDIDLVRAEEAKKRAEAQLASERSVTSDIKSEIALRRAITRIKAKTGRIIGNQK